MLNNAVSSIIQGESGKVNNDLFEIYRKSYFKAIESVYTEDIYSELVTRFKYNAIQLAAAKSYKVTSELADAKALLQGKQFEDEAKRIIQKYNRYQAAEYNTLTARCRTAKQWDQFKAEEQLYQNIEWLRTRSANPREQHLRYVGIILPRNHPFWLSNQPGNLYGCKCDWKTTDAPVTGEPEAIIPPSKGLEGNPANTGVLVTNKHTYFRINDAESKEIQSFTSKYIWNNYSKEALRTLRTEKLSLSIANIDFPVLFSRSGINHLFHNKVISDEFTSLKNIALPNINEYFKKMEYVSSHPNNDLENKMVVQYHYFKIKMFEKDVYLNVRELTSGELLPYALTPSIRYK